MELFLERYVRKPLFYVTTGGDFVQVKEGDPASYPDDTLRKQSPSG
jgi:hypothetical protein